MMYGSRLLETEVNLGLKLWLVLPHGQYTNIQIYNQQTWIWMKTWFIQDQQNILQNMCCTYQQMIDNMPP